MANTLYLLAAYDNSGRRYWRSPFVDLSRAPAPVGSYDASTLTVMASFPYGPITTALEGWWQASDLTLAQNGPVLQWPDASGNGMILRGDPTFFGSPPLMRNASANFGGQNAVYFQNSIALNMDRPSGFIGGDGAQSCYVVFNPVFLPGIGAAFGFGGNNFPGSRVVCFVGDSGCGNGFVSFDSFGSGIGAALSSGTHVASFAMAQGAAWDTCDFRIDGVAQSNAGAGTTPLNISQPMVQFEIGGFANDSGGNYTGEVAEVLCYAANHGPTERASVFSYLSQKYGLSL